MDRGKRDGRPWAARLGVLLLGVLVAAGALEVTLRTLGWAFERQQAAQNRGGGAGAVTVLCVGESTTAMGGEGSYPSQLQLELDQRLGPGKVRVVNRGILGGNSDVILAELPQNLARYRPAVVVAMMGANDARDRPGGPEFPAAERERGFPHNLRVVRLVRLLRYYGALEAARRAARGEEPERGRPTKKAAKGPKKRASEAQLRARLAAEPGDVETRLSLARHLQRAQQNAAALEQYREAARLDPGNERAHFGVGRMLRKLGRYAESAQSFRRVLQLNPQNGDAQVSLATSLFNAGGHDAEAREHYQRGLEINPRDRRAVIGLFNLFQRTSDHVAAEALAQRLAQGNPTDAQLGAAARYFEARGQRQRAEALFRRADALRLGSGNRMTRANYRRMHRLLRPRGIALLAVQYPGRRAAPLKTMVADLPGVTVADNRAPFQRALARTPYKTLFWDNCYGDFGHCTRAGCRLLARGVADALLPLLARAGVSVPHRGSVPPLTSDVRSTRGREGNR